MKVIKFILMGLGILFLIAVTAIFFRIQYVKNIKSVESALKYARYVADEKKRYVTLYHEEHGVFPSSNADFKNNDIGTAHGSLNDIQITSDGDYGVITIELNGQHKGLLDKTIKHKDLNGKKLIYKVRKVNDKYQWACTNNIKDKKYISDDCSVALHLL